MREPSSSPKEKSQPKTAAHFRSKGGGLHDDLTAKAGQRRRGKGVEYSHRVDKGGGRGYHCIISN